MPLSTRTRSTRSSCADDAVPTIRPRPGSFIHRRGGRSSPTTTRSRRRIRPNERCDHPLSTSPNGTAWISTLTSGCASLYAVAAVSGSSRGTATIRRHAALRVPMPDVRGTVRAAAADERRRASGRLPRRPRRRGATAVDVRCGGWGTARPATGLRRRRVLRRRLRLPSLNAPRPAMIDRVASLDGPSSRTRGDGWCVPPRSVVSAQRAVCSSSSWRSAVIPRRADHVRMYD